MKGSYLPMSYTQSMHLAWPAAPTALVRAGADLRAVCRVLRPWHVSLLQRRSPEVSPGKAALCWDECEASNFQVGSLGMPAPALPLLRLCSALGLQHVAAMQWESFIASAPRRVS